MMSRHVSSAAVLLLCGAAITSAAPSGSTTADQLSAVVTVTTKNFDQLPSEDEPGKPGFAFVFGTGDVPEEATDAAEKLAEFARVAYVDTEKQPEVLKNLGLTAETAPKWRVKPIGIESKFADHETADEAVSAVMDNIPENLAVLLADQSQIQSYVQQAYSVQTIPAIFFHTKNEVPKLIQKLSIWMGEDSSYAVMANPSDEIMKGFGIKKLPQMVLYVPQPPKEGEEKPEGQEQGMQLMPVAYNRKQFGGYKFKNLARFMAQVQSEVKQMGVLNKPEKQKKQKSAKKPAGIVPLFEYTAETKDACGEGKLGMCIVALFDGSPLNEAEKSKQLEILAEVQDSPSNKGRPLHFMWVDLSCHTSFGEFFGMSLDNAPTVLAISPKKAAWAPYFGGFAKDKIGVFISKVLSGKTRISPLPGDKKVPAIPASDDCAAVHAAMTPVEEDDIDMGDIMAEMQADAEEEEAAKAEAAKNAAPEEDTEMAAKRKKAEAEMERLNKMSNPKKKKKGGKKKKKKAKKAKKAKKEEL